MEYINVFNSFEANLQSYSKKSIEFLTVLM